MYIAYQMSTPSGIPEYEVQQSISGWKDKLACLGGQCRPACIQYFCSQPQIYSHRIFSKQTVYLCMLISSEKPLSEVEIGPSLPESSDCCLQGSLFFIAFISDISAVLTNRQRGTWRFQDRGIALYEKNKIKPRKSPRSKKLWNSSLWGYYASYLPRTFKN